MSRRLDTAETLANTCGGFFISYAVALGVFPLLGIPMDPAKAGAATFVMFLVSNVRAYAIRRMFRRIEARPRWHCPVCGKQFRSHLDMKDHRWTAHR